MTKLFGHITPNFHVFDPSQNRIVAKFWTPEEAAAFGMKDGRVFSIHYEGMVIAYRAANDNLRIRNPAFDYIRNGTVS